MVQVYRIHSLNDLHEDLSKWEELVALNDSMLSCVLDTCILILIPEATAMVSICYLDVCLFYFF